MFIHMRIRKHTHYVYLNPYVYVHIYKHICIYTHMHTHTHTHKHISIITKCIVALNHKNQTKCV